MIDELGNEVTEARVQAICEHIMFKSDSTSWEIGLILKALRVEVAVTREDRDAQAERADRAERREREATEAALKAASRGLMIYHIASRHTGIAAFCQTTGCRLERRDMNKIIGPFVRAEHEFVPDPIQPLCNQCDLPKERHFATTDSDEPRAGQPPQTEGDDYRQPCPNGCFGRLGDGCHGEPVPRYCGQNGCDAESPGMSYKPDEEWGPDSAAQELERGPR